MSLDKLVNSRSFVDRIKAAKNGYGLDVLVNDENWNVRRVVAKQRYGLDVLVRDSDEYVRKAAEEAAKELFFNSFMAKTREERRKILPGLG